MGIANYHQHLYLPMGGMGPAACCVQYTHLHLHVFVCATTSRRMTLRVVSMASPPEHPQWDIVSSLLRHFQEANTNQLTSCSLNASSRGCCKRDEIYWPYCVLMDKSGTRVTAVSAAQMLIDIIPLSGLCSLLGLRCDSTTVVNMCTEYLRWFLSNVAVSNSLSGI